MYCTMVHATSHSGSWLQAGALYSPKDWDNLQPTDFVPSPPADILVATTSELDPYDGVILPGTRYSALVEAIKSKDFTHERLASPTGQVVDILGEEHFSAPAQARLHCDVRSHYRLRGAENVRYVMLGSPFGRAFHSAVLNFSKSQAHKEGLTELASIGQRHLPGLKYILEKYHGFTPVPLTP